MSDSDQTHEILPEPVGEDLLEVKACLFVSDTEMYRRLGISRRTGRFAVLALERSGFPPRLPLWGNKRYWPAVRAFLDRHYGALPYDRYRHHSGENSEPLRGEAPEPNAEVTAIRLLARSNDQPEQSGA